MCDVPALRFLEFTEEWKRIRVSDLLDFYSTNSLSWEQLEYKLNEPYNLHYGLIHVGLPILVDLTKDELPSIKEGNVPKKYELCKEGDVAFADASEDTNEVAKVVEFYNLDGKKVVCGLHTIHGRDNNKQTAKGFLGYCFSSTVFHYQIRRIAQGTKIYSINTRNFSEVFVGLPSKSEQHKIATLLKLIDERISTQNKIIEDLRLLRDAIMVEHYRKCNKSKLCIYDIGEPFNVMNLSKDDLTKDGSPCIIYGELFTTYGCVIENVVSHTTKSPNSTLSTKGDLLFPASTTVDALSLIAPSSINEDGIILGGDMFGIHVNEQYNSNYLSYYFNIIGKKNLAKYAKGSTIIHLHYADIQKAKITLPNKNEQEAVANLLLKVEHKLNIEQKMLINYLNTKNFLLWQMFI